MNPTSQPLVSIVTPVYQGAEYLTECIESILTQTYQNWEYSIVDNCSTDESLEIANQYASRDQRIRVCRNQQFLEAIANHNAALRQIHPKSKYCKVVFADDKIFPQCLERMVALAEQHVTVGLVGANCLEGQQVICKGLPESCSVITGKDICRQTLLDKLHVFGSANSVLYRADLVRNRNPFYNEANIHADTEVCFELLRSTDFGFVHEVLTFTRLRAGSLNTISAAMHTDYASILEILKKYGAYYFAANELESLFSHHLSEYYRLLGKSVLLGRKKKFWDYHKKKLSELGIGLSRASLGKAALASMFTALLKPGDAISRLRQRRSNRAK